MKKLKRPGHRPETLRVANSRAAWENQRITRQGKEGVVVISDEQYERLMVKLGHPKSLVQFFRESPLVSVDRDLERDKGLRAALRYERLSARHHLPF